MKVQCASPENPWWGDQRQAVLNAVLTASVNELKDISGDDPVAWTWGRIHTMTFAHPMGSIGRLSLIFNRGPFPIGGNWNTVNSGAYFPDEPYQMALGPAYRFIVELAVWDNARSVITTGQSGQPFSPHYDDNIDDWRSVDYHTLPFSQTAVQEKNAVHTLTLLPGVP